jgi:hypothetical protein
MNLPSDIPVPRAGVRFEELHGEAVVYDRSGKRASYLNDTATIIWKMCNGTNSIPEIVETLVKEFPENAASVATDVRETIERLVQERLVVFVAPKSDVGPESDQG